MANIKKSDKPAKTDEDIYAAIQRGEIKVTVETWYRKSRQGLLLLALLSLIMPLLAPFVYGYALQAESETEEQNGGAAAKFFLLSAKRCAVAGMGILTLYVVFLALQLLSFISGVTPF